MYPDASRWPQDCSRIIQECLKIKKIGLIWLKHVPNCRERMPMFEELSRIIQNHNDCSRVSPRIFKNHPDCSSRGHSGQKSGQCDRGFRFIKTPKSSITQCLVPRRVPALNPVIRHMCVQIAIYNGLQCVMHTRYPWYVNSREALMESMLYVNTHLLNSVLF
jgi:hypothetical protein